MTWTRQNNNWKKAYNKLAEDYFDLQQTNEDLTRLIEERDELLDERASLDTLSMKSCCGQTTFIADSKGVIDRPIPGTYNITLIIKEENTEEKV